MFGLRHIDEADTVFPIKFGTKIEYPLSESYFKVSQTIGMMDAYACAFVARGPTLAEDGITPTGSMHIVDLPDAKAALAMKSNYAQTYFVFGDFSGLQ